MASRMLDEAKAKAWMIEVDDEVDAVDRLLEDVEKELETNPHEDDTILNLLREVGSGFGGAWKELIMNFRNTSETTKNIIARMSEGVTKTLEEISSFVQGKQY